MHILNTIEVNSLQELRFGNQLQVCKLGVVNFTKRFIVIKIFQILVLPPVSFYTHQNISHIFLGDEIYLLNLTFHDIANY